MSYQRETLQLHSVAPDLIPQDAPLEAWNDAANVFFRNGESYRALGDAPTLPNAQADARTAVYVEVAGQGFWVYATNLGIFAHDGAVEFDITPAAGWTGADAATFTSCVLNGIAYINASDRDPVYWGGAPLEGCEPLPDWPSNGRCLALRAHKNFLFGIGFISEGDQRVRWSDAAEAGTVPQSWTPAPDNFAGFVDLAPLSAACLEGASLRDSFVVYKNESVWSFDFVGGNAVFRVRKIFAEHGIVNTNALTRGIDDVHLFVGSEGDVFITDGVQVRSVLDGRAQRAFYAAFVQNKNGLFAAATLAREKVGLVCYPANGSTRINQALVFDFITQDIGFRDMPDILCAAEGGKLSDGSQSNVWDGDPQSWDDDGTPWPFEVSVVTLDDVLVAGAFGFAVVSDPEAEDFIGGEVFARVEKSGLAFGDAQVRKMVSRIWPKITGRDGDQLEIRLGGQEITGGPVALQPPVMFTIGQDYPIDTFVQGRFLSMEITSQGGAPWRMGTMDLEFKEVGGW